MGSMALVSKGAQRRLLMIILPLLLAVFSEILSPFLGLGLCFVFLLFRRKVCRTYLALGLLMLVILLPAQATAVKPNRGSFGSTKSAIWQRALSLPFKQDGTL